MASVAEVWLADELAGLKVDPSPHLQVDLHRCARETGWKLGGIEMSAQPYIIHHAVAWTPPHGGADVQMRVGLSAPVLGFVPSSGSGWGQPYVDVPPLTLWWQRAGWLVPDAPWLNAPYTGSELSGLDASDARELRRWPTLSRGDALFFEW